MRGQVTSEPGLSSCTSLPSRHQDSLWSIWERALKHVETLLVLVQWLWLCKLHLRASQRLCSFWAIHEDTFKKRQFGVLHLQCTGITIAPCDRTCNTGSWRFIFMTVRMEKYWLLIFSFHRFPWTWSTFQTNLIFKTLFAVSNCPCVQGLFPAVSSGPLHYPMVRIVKLKRQNSKLWCYIWISVGFITILGIIYFLLKGRGE